MRAAILATILVVSCVTLDQDESIPGCDESEDYYDEHDTLEDEEEFNNHWGFRWKK